MAQKTKAAAPAAFMATGGAVAAFLAILSLDARAADMPVKAAPRVVPAYSWTGFYVGGLVAGGWGHSEHCDPLTGCAAGSATFNMSGWLGGVTVGYNWQAANWVFGAEGDGSWGRIKGSMASGAAFDCGTGGTCNTNINAVGTVRARLGYALDRFLPYVTAGAAFTNVKASDGGGSATFFISDTKTETSFVWGGGVEYAFTPRWSAKFEFLRVEKLGDFTYGHVTGICACFLTDTHYEMARFGVNYRLGGP